MIFFYHMVLIVHTTLVGMFVLSTGLKSFTHQPSKEYSQSHSHLKVFVIMCVEIYLELTVYIHVDRITSSVYSLYPVGRDYGCTLLQGQAQLKTGLGKSTISSWPGSSVLIMCYIMAWYGTVQPDTHQHYLYTAIVKAVKTKLSQDADTQTGVIAGIPAILPRLLKLEKEDGGG